MKIVCVNPVETKLYGHVTRGVVITASEWAGRETLAMYPDDFVVWTGPGMVLPAPRVRYALRHRPFETDGED